MENAINAHLSSSHISSIIFPVKFKSELIRRDKLIELHFYDFSGVIKFEYKLLLIHLRELLTSFSEDIVDIDGKSHGLEDIMVKTKQRSLVWNKTGELIEETYFNGNYRKIRYVNKSMIIMFTLYYFLYDLKGYIEKEKHLPYLLYSDKYKVNIEKIANGNLNLVVPNNGTFYYIDDNGNVDNNVKVNVIAINPIFRLNRNDPYLTKLNTLIKEVPDKLKKEAQKLRMDYKNYIPEL